MLFLSGALIVPLLGIIVVGILNFEGYIVGIAALLTFLGGILRMLYALLFESSNPGDETLEDTIIETKQKLFEQKIDCQCVSAAAAIYSGCQLRSARRRKLARHERSTAVERY